MDSSALGGLMVQKELTIVKREADHSSEPCSQDGCIRPMKCGLRSVGTVPDVDLKMCVTPGCPKAITVGQADRG